MSIESIVYSQVKRLPWLKDILRTLYQWANLPWLGEKVECAREITLYPGYFFGFHDKTPWSRGGSLVLAHRVDGQFEPGQSEVTVGYFECGETKLFHPVGTTRAWSKQQGAQLQWSGQRDEIVFNILDDQNKAGARRVTLEGDLVMEYEFPIGAVDASGRNACIVDYCTFGACMQGYGYGRELGSLKDVIATGLAEIDLESGKVCQHATLGEVCGIAGWVKTEDHRYFISHPQYSSSGERIAFFVRRHRHGLRIETRLCVFDRMMGTVSALSQTKMASHFCWLDDVNVLVYLETEKGSDEYRIINTANGASTEASGLPSVDGHPNYSRVTRSLVLDAYPDRRRRQRLGVYIYDGNDQFTVAEQMSLYSPLEFRNADRVDLHPRWDRTGQDICVDCSFNGSRSMAILHHR